MLQVCFVKQGQSQYCQHEGWKASSLPALLNWGPDILLRWPRVYAPHFALLLGLRSFGSRERICLSATAEVVLKYIQQLLKFYKPEQCGLHIS